MKAWLVTLTATATILTCPALARSQAPAPPLGADRYAAIERVLEASVAVDPDPPNSDERRSIRLCAGLPRRDPVLAAYRSTCIHGARSLRLTLRPCRGLLACARRFDALSRLVAKSIESAGPALRVYRREVPDRRCRDAIRVAPRSLRAYGRLEVALADLARALRSRSDRRIAAADRRVSRARRPIREDQVNLRLLRRHCR